MKKVVLSLALVAMMFVSCKEAAENTEATMEETVEAVEATTEEAVEAVEVAADSAVTAIAAGPGESTTTKVVMRKSIRVSIGIMELSGVEWTG